MGGDGADNKSVHIKNEHVICISQGGERYGKTKWGTERGLLHSEQGEWVGLVNSERGVGLVNSEWGVGLVNSERGVGLVHHPVSSKLFCFSC